MDFPLKAQSSKLHGLSPMNKKDAVQILLATHNGEKHLYEQIRSLLNQTYPSIQIQASDDCSKDNTTELLKKNSIPTLLADKPLGCKGNFSKLLASRKAPYIAFSDQDDVWLPGKIECCMKAMKDAETQFSHQTPILIHTDLKVVNEGLSEIAPSFWNYSGLDPLNKSNFSHLLVQNNVTGCTVLINEALADLVGEIPEESLMHDWWIALVASAFGKIIVLDRATILYRQHGKNTLGAKKAGIRTYIDKALNKGLFKGTNEQQIKRKKQAEKFLERYSSKLSLQQIQLLETLIKADEKNWVYNQLQAFRHGLLRQSTLTRSIGLMLRNPF